MTIAFVSPFGSRHEEAGLLYLVANYLRARSESSGAASLVQLRCNGAFSVCDRDADRDWKRGMHSCLSCMQDQRSHAEWSGMPAVDATLLLPAEVVESTKRFAALLSSSSLLTCRYDGFELASLWRGSFVNRFGVPTPDLSNKQHEQFARRMVLSVVRSLEIAKRFNNRFQPTVSCVVGSEDYFVRSFVAQSREQGRAIASFRWNLTQRVISIERSFGNAAPMACELVLDGVTEMRQDPSTWSKPVLDIAEQIVQYLGFVEATETLPQAQ